ncbi:hypothetical protein [Algihabitans sp.]|uniref:hypothetical protein n=1 Tax=Algihabitans sp. TaxID=2821514 RepID=UPI003BAD7819
MLYLIALFFPFVSLLLVRKPVQATISLLLHLLAAFLFVTVIASWLGFILFTALVLHAFFVVHGAQADRRAERIAEAVRRSD